MGTRKRLLGILFAFFFAVLCTMGETYSWQSLGQDARNEVTGEPETLEEGTLTIEKVVKNADGSGLSEEQLGQSFAFTVTFSDGGTYRYRIDGDKEESLTSGGTIYLKHGQKAVFVDIPEGVTYKVTETEVEPYQVLASGSEGRITKEDAYALFINQYEEHPSTEDGVLKVTKVVKGTPPDKEKEFQFTVTVEGTENSFTLKDGDSKEFVLPGGSHYEVREEDYTEDGYQTTITNGSGVIQGGQTIESVVTNTFVEDENTEIAGEKIWKLEGADASKIPSSIRVLLKNGDKVVADATVTPNADGKWFYDFHVPKYDEQGKEIIYTVEELPVEGFRTSYEGYNIINTFIQPKPTVPQTLPQIEKVVEGTGVPDKTFTFILTGQDGAPMPEGAIGQSYLVNIQKSGKASLGKITFQKSGTYVYTLEEKQWDWENWQMDESIYTLTYVVTEQNGALVVSQKITCDGQEVSGEFLTFVNQYQDPEEAKKEEKVTISGEKKWSHRSNLVDNWPTSATIYIYGDGEQVAEEEVTEETNWRYLVELPKYGEDGHEIVYTIGEKPIAGYDTQVQGYNVMNIYHTEEESSDGEDKDETTGGTGSQIDTSDPNPIGRYVLTLFLSLFSIWLTLYARYQEYQMSKKRRR